MENNILGTLKTDIQFLIFRYSMYGLNLVKTDSHIGDDGIVRLVVKVEVPSHSQIKINDEEACGSTLAKNFKDDYLKIVCKGVDPEFIPDDILRVKYKEYDKYFTFQDVADGYQDSVLKKDLAGQAWDTVYNKTMRELFGYEKPVTALNEQDQDVVDNE